MITGEPPGRSTTSTAATARSAPTRAGRSSWSRRRSRPTDRGPNRAQMIRRPVRCMNTRCQSDVSRPERWHLEVMVRSRVMAAAVPRSGAHVMSTHRRRAGDVVALGLAVLLGAVGACTGSPALRPRPRAGRAAAGPGPQHRSPRGRAGSRTTRACRRSTSVRGSAAATSPSPRTGRSRAAGPRRWGWPSPRPRPPLRRRTRCSTSTAAPAGPRSSPRCNGCRRE